MVNANVNANQATSRHAHLRQEGRAADPADDRPRRSRAGARRPRGTTGTIPAYAAGSASSNSNYSNKSDNTNLRRRQDRHPRGDRPGRGQQPDRVGAGRQDGAGGVDSGDQERGGRRGRPERQARRQPRRCPRSRSRSPPPLPPPASSTKMIGYAKYALDRPRRPAVPVLHEPQHPQAREGGLHRPAHLAARARDPASARGARIRRRSGSPTVKRLRPPVNVPKRQVEELVERDPDRVAQQVRAWMSED